MARDVKAMLHLNQFYPSHQRRWKQVSPSSKELYLAKACLDAVPKEFLNTESTSVHKATYYLTLSEYHRFFVSDNDQQAMARDNLQLARVHAINGNCFDVLKWINARLELFGSDVSSFLS